MRKRRLSDSQRYSILTDRLDTCYECGYIAGIELHEIYFGSNRENSKYYGLCVPLCEMCHRGTYGVHGSKGKKLNDKLKKVGQEAFEKKYPELNFIEIFGKNYL